MISTSFSGLLILSPSLCPVSLNFILTDQCSCQNKVCHTNIVYTLFNKCQIKDMIGTSSLKLHGCQTGLIFITFPALWYHNIAAADTGDILDILTFGPQPSRGDTARCYQHSDGDCCRRCAPRVSAARGSAGRRV